MTTYRPYTWGRESDLGICEECRKETELGWAMVCRDCWDATLGQTQ